MDDNQDDRSGITRRTTLSSFRALAVPYLGYQVTAAPRVRVESGNGFLQAGRGAQPRSVDSKLRETVSVADFGARGDGVTDDTTAFSAAIATGKSVFVPYTPAGYAVAGIDVISNMQIIGEKSGMARAPLLIVTRSGSSAFRNASRDHVFHCVFENLACTAAPGVTNAGFYAQDRRTHYSGYFTFRAIETYLTLRTSYRGLFIFVLWDRCRDGYLGSATDSGHGAIAALADAYGQTNQQNLNRVRDTMIFNAFGCEAAVVGSFGIQWSFENTNFEALRTRAIAAYNLLQVGFSNCWFEDIRAAAIAHVGVYPGTAAASTIRFDHCHFVLNGTAPFVAVVDNPGTVSVRDSLFSLVRTGVRLCDDGARVATNEGNLAVSGPGAAGFFLGNHADTVAGGRRFLNGAPDNRIAAITLQNGGAIAATDGFLSRTDIQVGREFTTIATSRTGLGGTCIVSGYDPTGGAQLRLIKDWQGGTVRDVVAPLNATGRILAFRTSGAELQMRVEGNPVTVFTTLLH